MFERFTDDGRRVVLSASDEALGLGHDRIGTEHLLLGLLRVEEGIAAQVLSALGVGLEQTRAAVAERVVSAERVAPVTGEIRLTPRAKKVLELSLREALALGQNEIDTEHILLGLARENDGIASGILEELGVDAQTIRMRRSRGARREAGVGAPAAISAGARRPLRAGSTTSSGATSSTSSGSTRSARTAGSS